MKRSTKYIPEGLHTVTPYLTARNAAKALDFYKRAFGAKELHRMPGPDDRIMHAAFQIGDSQIFISDEFTEMPNSRSPETLNGSPVSILIYVQDVDSVFNTATQAGATAVEKPKDMFWGDRWSTVRDPFGHNWQIATHVEEVTPEEMKKRMAQMMSAPQR
jgi:PhnB protein